MGLRYIAEAKVSDGRGGIQAVRVGSKVDLLPLTEAQKRKWNAEYNFHTLQKWLGEGPYVIGHIGQWPCGGITIYVRTADSEPGVEASRFMAAA